MVEKVIWTEIARQELDDVYWNFHEYSEIKATKWADDLFHQLELLEHFPAMGRIVPEKEIEFIREVFVGDYRLIYSYQNKLLTILRVWYSKIPLGKI